MSHRASFGWIIALQTIALIPPAPAQQQQPTPPPIGLPHVALDDGPFVIDTAEQHKIRVVVVTTGLSHPWSLAFLPGGYMLVTEPTRKAVSIVGKA